MVIVGLLQLVQLERLHALHRLLTVAHFFPDNAIKTQIIFDDMMMKGIYLNSI